MTRLLRTLAVAAAVAVAASATAWATQRVEVTELGADPSGAADSSRAFQDAVWRAGIGGLVTCEPGRYKVADLLLFYPKQTWRCPAELVPASGARWLLAVGYWGDKPKPQLLDIEIRELDGRGVPDLTCLMLRDTFGSRFAIPNVTRCARGVALEPERHGVWNNTFEGLAWGNNGTAITVARGDGCTEGNIFNINFVAWNDLGLHLPDTGPCGGAMTSFVGGFDFNGRDAIINGTNGFYRFGFVTPNGEPIGVGLDSSVVHTMNRRTWRFGPLMEVEDGDESPHDLRGLLR